MILYEAKHKDELACLMIAYYDLILVDGKATGEEDKAFHKLCNEMKVDESLESTVKQYCVRTIGSDSKNRVQKATENMRIVLQDAKSIGDATHDMIANLFGKKSLKELSEEAKKRVTSLNIGNHMTITKFVSLSLKREQLTFLWNLFKVGYADGALCEEEKEVLKSAAGHLRIDDFYVAEYTDAANTITDLKELKHTLHQMNLPKETIKTKVADINKQIRQIEKDEEITADQCI